MAMADMWEVVGGAERGGVIVRLQCDLSSEVAESRLSTGSMVKELDCHDGRIHYELVSGTGPISGWVSTSLRGKDLLVKKTGQATRSVRSGGIFSQWVAASAGKQEVNASEDSTSDDAQACSASGASGSEEEEEVMQVPAIVAFVRNNEGQKPAEKLPNEDEKEALKQYSEKFGECRDGGNPGYNRKAFPWFTRRPQEKLTPSEELEKALAFKSQEVRKQRKGRMWDVDSEGEEIPLCSRCHLPVGEFAYAGKQGSRSCVHTECMAQELMQEAQEEDDTRAERENQKKLVNRKEYEIGWRMDSVPKSGGLAERLGCSPAPKGLCCLVLDEATRTVRVAATLEPAAAVNLEYLILALKVRKQACREPLFSLDPTDPHKLESCPQKKVYEPSWLAGTSVGDVMFQADYFLKELALGEYTMPVAGMQSVFDWTEMENSTKQWAGREWFVVKKAEIRMAADKTLIPHVKMGVEAREQVLTKDGLKDAPVTGANHPLKKFAEAFTRNFDLIAERKSVIFHLRELAKASVMAKYLVDSKARLDASWYDIADQIVKDTPPEAHPEIPQLWNMRGNSRIQLKNGRLIDMVTGGQSQLQAIYGGVEFGLDRFELSQRHAIQGQAAPGMQLGQSGRPMFMPQRFQLQQRGETPQGVDLNLDKFSLSSEDRFSCLPACSAGPDSLEARVHLGKAFLQGWRDGELPGFKEEHQQLVMGIYSSPQCDRTEEGDAFTPPDPNMEYINRVSNLVNEEISLRDRRKSRFCDKSFVVGNPGTEFPRCWTSRFQIEKEGGRKASAPTKFGLVKIEVDEAFQRCLTMDVLPSAVPEFNRSTEDGTVFRIYKIGTLEVRTVQLPERQETVGVVFSSRAQALEMTSGKKEVPDLEKFVQGKVYIEALESGDAKASYNFYVVLETEGKNFIVTEKLSNGDTTLVVNPLNLEDRNSMARLLFTADSKDGICVRDLKEARAMHNQIMPQGALSSHRKHYAKAIFKLVSGRSFRGKWGGLVRRYTGSSVSSYSTLSANLSRAAQARSTEFLNGMWSARKSADTTSRKSDLQAKTPGFY
eukprot:gb/GFBE01055774.1/.p1 GENE.gb/GFBE01055774.1/~~gb/GFBE01055774.1/.p1  ORF type:complete len:1053 (+),score=292.89 gb/GFBE01055774.1/:1-3159(+)